MALTANDINASNIDLNIKKLLLALVADIATAGSGAGVPAATKTVAGVVKESALVAGAAGANPTQAEYAALLAALKAAGLMSST